MEIHFSDKAKKMPNQPFKTNRIKLLLILLYLLYSYKAHHQKDWSRIKNYMFNNYLWDWADRWLRDLRLIWIKLRVGFKIKIWTWIDQNWGNFQSEYRTHTVGKNITSPSEYNNKDEEERCALMRQLYFFMTHKLVLF